MGKNAFTLIELLIVVAIIGILAAIAIPNFQNARIRAQISKVKSELRTVTDAADMYYKDHGWYPPCFDNWKRPGDPFNSCTYIERAGVLSTPVLYLQIEAMIDPFANPDETLHSYQYYMFGPESQKQGHYLGVSGDHRRTPHGICTGSNGPDKNSDYIMGLPLVVWEGGGNFKTLSAVSSSSGAAYIYMSSNGLRSMGDIGRVGGDTPPILPVQIGG